ncbi:DsrE family protein [Arthrobacter sp. I2-34]|uniref:DsrE family protein n=1 Tax=Arthrobacter hankyongi TaxID=2904801 RepID=A0ABS9L687_9MICC|nr:DsrE family protein [Arthrobacter hankyongi]MCG2622179.1 DsrE family protein [Arthrobacter hankyongi]
MEVVVQGAAVTSLARGTDLSESLAVLLRNGIAILACENSMRSAGLDAGGLTAGVGTVPAAVAYLARRQWEGWAYVRL